MVTELCVEQMKYAQHNESAEAPAQATEQASAASVAGEGTHVHQEKGIFGSAESHARSVLQAAASIPGAIGSVPAAVAGAGALAAGMVSQHCSNNVIWHPSVRRGARSYSSLRRDQPQRTSAPTSAAHAHSPLVSAPE